MTSKAYSVSLYKHEGEHGKGRRMHYIVLITPLTFFLLNKAVGQMGFFPFFISPPIFFVMFSLLFSGRSMTSNTS